MTKSRTQSLGEEIGNAITHGVGGLFGIAATVMMLLKSDTTIEYVASSIFGVCMIILYTMSCLYHAFKHDTKVKQLFRIFDHLSIFLLIGGTYAPVLLIGFLDPIGISIFAFQWIMIAIGVCVKLFIKPKRAILHTIICVLIGWSGLVITPQIYQMSVPLFWFILAGGLAYTIGIAFFASRFKYSHFVWHFFVLFGTILHFVGIYLYLL